mgnify:CR=1 FL=1
MAVNNDTALATVQDVLNELGLTSEEITSEQLASIEMLIEAYSSAVAGYLGRELGYSLEISEQFSGSGRTPRIITKRKPVYSVTSFVPCPGAAPILWADACARIEGNGKSGVIWAPQMATFTGLMSPWITQQPLQGTENEYRTINYEAGWKLPGQETPAYVIPLPGEIRLAVIKGVAADFQSMGSGAGSSNAGVKSESLMSHSVTYESGADLGVDSSRFTAIGMSIPLQLQQALSRHRSIAQF